MNKKPDNQLAHNKYASFQYNLLEQIEAGIVLTGAEVKSIKARNINLKPAYISIENNEAILKNCHISPYQNAPDPHYQPDKNRKLLLHKEQIIYLEKQINENRLTVVPVSIYLKKGKIKISIALAQGKKMHDKRQDLKKKSQNREIQRHFRSN